ncbi:MAG TPA: GNAT family N-acetyltransferase [Candidatus Saccharimonadales bacterium]|nr:GNAT family N-acetyltransferase [Candidatus Saccharimonadales bacterium]
MTSSRDCISKSFKTQLSDHYYLDPYRFETKFYYHALDLDLFISYQISNYQLSTIKYGILKHGLDFIRKIHRDTQTVIFFIKKNETILGVLKGIVCKESLFIETMHMSHPQYGLILLEKLKDYLRTHNIDHASTDVLMVNTTALDVYQQSGFTVKRSMAGDAVCKMTTCDIKFIKQCHLTVEIHEYSNHEIANSYYDDLIGQYEQSQAKTKNTNSYGNKLERFGLFMRDKKNAIVAGVIGEITSNAGVKNLNIDRLWVAESYRGNNFSKHLIHKAEVHAIERGCRFSSLHTMEYYAPWLYSKLGYQVFFKQKIGNYEGYYYHKDINLCGNKLRK